MGGGVPAVVGGFGNLGFAVWGCGAQAPADVGYAVDPAAGEQLDLVHAHHLDQGGQQAAFQHVLFALGGQLDQIVEYPLAVILVGTLLHAGASFASGW